MQNPYYDQMAKLSDEALINVLRQKEDYEPVAAAAAEQVANERGLTASFIQEEIQRQETAIQADQIKQENKIFHYFKSLFALLTVSFVFDKESAKEHAVEDQSLIERIVRYLFQPKILINLIASGSVVASIFTLGLFDNIQLSIETGEWFYGIISILTVLFAIGIAALLYQRKKSGWVILNLNLIFGLHILLVRTYVALFIQDHYWVQLYPAQYTLYFIAGCLVNLGLLIYIHTPQVLDYFNVQNKLVRKSTAIIAFVVTAFGTLEIYQGVQLYKEPEWAQPEVIEALPMAPRDDPQ